MLNVTVRQVLKKAPLLAIMLAALAVRVAFIHHWGSSLMLYSDDVGYIDSARRLVTDHVFSWWRPRLSPEPALGPTAYVTPGYPFFLSFFLWVFSEESRALAAARYAQAFLMVGSVYLTYLIGSRFGGRWAGLIPAALVAFYPPLILINGLLLTETLFTFLLLLFTYQWVKTEPDNEESYALLGILGAAAALVRPTGALLCLAAFCGLLLWLRRRKPARAAVLRSAAVLLVTFFLVLSPWWVRNAFLFHRFIPLSASGGNPLLLGTYVNLEGIKYGWQPLWPVGKDPMETGQLHTALALERLEKGFREDFGRYLDWYTRGKFKLLWGKVFLWGGEDKLPANFTYWCHYVIVALGSLGLACGLARRLPGAGRILGLLAAFTLMHLVTYAHCRYALPLLPVLASAVVMLLKPLKRRPSF
ncbi:MAG: glycosyltransferase family 39 protein [Bacillota bacterium]